MTALNDTRAGTADSMDITGSGQARSLAKPRTPGRIRLRVRASEVDPYNIAHHSNYPIWFEVGRTDFIKMFKTTYTDLENAGVMLPLVNLNCHFNLPAMYED